MSVAGSRPENQGQSQGQKQVRSRELQDGKDLLDQALQKQPADRRESVKATIAKIVEEAARDAKSVPRKRLDLIRQHIAELDRQLGVQVAEILHHPDVQRLEGSWRGLHQLVQQSQTSPGLKIKILDATRDEFTDDLLKNEGDAEATNLWRSVYESEFDTAGGKPFSSILLDYQFSHRAEDVTCLEQIAAVGGSAMCPFITAPSPDMFGMESFQELGSYRDLSAIFEDRRYTRWKSFRQSADSCWVTMVMPRALARLPYGKETSRVRSFDFEEIPLDKEGRPAPADHSKFCWTSAVYAMGQVLTTAFDRYGWCTAIRGRDSGGAVEQLPCYTFMNDDGEWDLKCPTEIGITGRKDAALGTLGFLPLCHYKDTDLAVFFGGQSVQEPRKFVNDPDADANAKVTGRLPYLMAASRIAHYLKCAGRDWIGSFAGSDAEALRTRLSDWIAQYVNADEKASEEMKAKFPLREASIEVVPIPGKPGEYHCVALLRPWLQLESLTTSIRMVAAIRAPR